MSAYLHSNLPTFRFWSQRDFATSFGNKNAIILILSWILIEIQYLAKILWINENNEYPWLKSHSKLRSLVSQIRYFILKWICLISKSKCIKICHYARCMRWTKKCCWKINQNNSHLTNKQTNKYIHSLNGNYFISSRYY